MPRPLPIHAFRLLRRHLLLLGLAPAMGHATTTAAQTSRPARQAPVFPLDHGSHPATRIEWWYITGHARAATVSGAPVFGFQLTFFRARVEAAQQMRSQFAARHLLFAHAALCDVAGRRFLHDQRIARAGLGIAQASTTDMEVHLRDWSLARRDARYLARIPADGFALALDFSPTAPLLLQGEDGWSRKGPQPAQASHYYSHPQLAFAGHLEVAGQRVAVTGSGARHADGANATPVDGAAWLDHEWSDSLLDAAAVGWDWIGINLFDGSCLMAFRIRDKAGATLWDGGSYRPARVPEGTPPQVFRRGDTVFQPVRHWTSPRTQARYPVDWQLRTPHGHYLLRALLDDQELDSRSSTGAIYWEGLCDLFDGQRRHVGRGYLELTGYARPLVL